MFWPGRFVLRYTANRYIKIDKTSRIFYIYVNNDKCKVISYNIELLLKVILSID